jgi:hypothetical protein
LVAKNYEPAPDEAERTVFRVDLYLQRSEY